MATNTGHVMTLANSIIGVSVLAMPFCFKQCGIALAICMLILSGITSRLACHFLVKSSSMCRRRNFEFLAFSVFGPSGKLLVELGVIGFMLGTCVAFFVVMGDLGPAIISKMFLIEKTTTLRSSVLIGLAIFIVLPLGMLRNVESLAAISTATIGFYFLLVIKMLSESSPHLIAGDWIDNVNFWRPEGVLQCVPIFAMALSCQTQIFEIYESLPVPSLDKINSVVRAAVNICTGVYISVGLLGYIAYSAGNFSGNILLSFAPSFSSEMYKLGFVMSIAVSFPLVIFPCRASLYSLLFRKMPIHHELSQTSSHIPDSRFKCLTITIILVSLCTGLLIPSIELVLGFVGSTIGIAICVIFPALAFINLTNKETNERLMAKATLIVGVLIMIVGSYGNLYAAAETKSIDTTPVKSSILLEPKIPLHVEVNTESVKMIKKELLENNPIVEDVKVPDIPALVPIVPNPLPVNEPEKMRKEPPVPVAPLEKVEKVEPVKPDESKNPVEKKPGFPSENQEKKKVIESEKVPENINKDAIEKEERELQEVEKQKKSEEDRKQQEVLNEMKEYKDEQKKILQEQKKLLQKQEKFLAEMKNRESEKTNEKIKEEQPAKPMLPEVKPIEPKKFDENIEKIQNVIDDLKDTKQAIEKEKMEIKAMADVPKENPQDTKPNETVVTMEEIKMEAKKKLPSMPLPLVKLQPKVEQAESKDAKSKQEALGRDILGDSEQVREKRDADGSEIKIEECHKQEMIKTDAEPKTEASPDQDIIRNSRHLSVPEEPKMAAIEDSKTLPDPKLLVIPKKRDLKSIGPTQPG